MTEPNRYPVLVVGGGPVGLTAATDLVRRGVPVRCVDRAAGPSRLSKALLVWPRTLEILRRLGGAAGIAELAMPLQAFRYYSSGVPVGTIAFRPRTKPVIMPQPDVETLLLEALARQGGTIERSTELLGLEQHADRVTAVLRGPDGTVESADFSHVIGADGASSTVREVLGIGFEGLTYPNTFVVADAELEGDLAPDTSHYYCSPKGVLVTCGLPGGRFRVFTSAPPDLDRDQVTLAQVQHLVDERGPGGLVLRNPTWVSAFSVHARHAERTRSGRVFLLGDAAHIHSPAGGQGLNTGVGDAHNLTWRLALVHRGLAGEALLDGAEQERGQVAKAIVKQADLQTRTWLLRRPYQTATRDLLLRAASAARLADLWYVPWLAGLRTVYRPVDGSRARSEGGFTEGALVGDADVWDALGNRRAPLQEALDDRGYTLLLVTDGVPLDPATADEVRGITAAHPDLVRLRVLDRPRNTLTDSQFSSAQPRDGRLRRGRRAPLLVLVRPDQHVALVRPAARADLVASALRRVAARDRAAQLAAV